MVADLVEVLVTLAAWEVFLPVGTLPKFKLAGANCSDSCSLTLGAWPLRLPMQPAVKLATEAANNTASNSPARGAALLSKVRPMGFLLPVDSMLIALPPLQLQGR